VEKLYASQAIPQIDPPEAEKRAISGWKLIIIRPDWFGQLEIEALFAFMAVM